MAIRVILADDHRLFRDGLRTLLQQDPEIKVVAETTDGLETIQAIKKHKPEIILMDISMPNLNGIEAARKISKECPKTKIIMLSMHSDRRFVQESFKAGAVGYILKDCAIDSLLDAIHTVNENQYYLDKTIASIVIKDFVHLHANQPDSVFAVLSSREREVLQLMAEGLSTKEIADKINISVKTVETHRKQLMDKLDIHNIAQLTKYAIREGLTSLDQ
jgi:DNA-binding NarL/FixJ family response regulator